MTFRTRVFLGSLVTATIPLAALGYVVSREGSRRLEQQYRIRVDDRVREVSAVLDGAARDLSDRLEAVAARILEDDELRLALVSGTPPTGYVRDWSGNAMALSGLDMLQIQDDAGRILSSGHFRGDFGRSDPNLPRLLGGGGTQAALVSTATAGGSRLMLARATEVTVGSVLLHVVGGMDARSVIPERDEPPLSVALVLDSDAPTSASDSDAVREALSIPLFVGEPVQGGADEPARMDTARVVIRHDLDAVRALRRQTAGSLAFAVLLASLFAAAVSRWMADRITRPLEELARKTTRVDMNRLDVVFDTGHADEVGRLSRFLDGMTVRIRDSTQRMRSAERRAALGDVARQVNHDVKNAVAPIRNVVRHLEEVERSRPADLAGVFKERLGTLQSGVDYLAQLAGRYGRLGNPGVRAPFDVRDVLATLREGRADGARIVVEVPDRPLHIHGDPLALRRILENLVGNAVESLRTPDARVTVAAHAHVEQTPDGPRPSVTLTVRDQGHGMDGETLRRAQQDFYTTREEGTGLGLSIVRRLVTDLEGTMVIESEPEQGTSVELRFPRSGAGPSSTGSTGSTGSTVPEPAGPGPGGP